MKTDNVKRIRPSELSNKKKENYNFHKQAAELADYGFNCIKLSDDWEGADFLAHHDEITLKVQLKSRITIDKKYIGKNLYMLFPCDEKEVNSSWYLIKHDLLVDIIRVKSNWLKTSSWNEKGLYKSRKIPPNILPDLQKYIINNKAFLNL